MTVFVFLYKIGDEDHETGSQKRGVSAQEWWNYTKFCKILFGDQKPRSKHSAVMSGKVSPSSNVHWEDLVLDGTFQLTAE